MENAKVDVIDVPEDIARYIMCKEHEWVRIGTDYNPLDQHPVYAGKCKHCGKPIHTGKPTYEFNFTL